jgi:phage-related protein
VSLKQPKPVVWVGSSLRDMRELPTATRRTFGVSLYAIQCGETPPTAKPLKGLGSGVLELVEQERGGTYRAVYAVRFESAIYVLHVFQKKSKTGKATPQRDIEVIKQRLMRAAELDLSERNKS